MRHRIHLKKLSKTAAHRKAMIRNMLVALFKYEQIKTTRAKGKVLQRYAERMITRARKDTVARRRLVVKWVQDPAILAKLFNTIAPMFSERNGGYTRLVKIGQRYGDASEMVYLSLVVFSDVNSPDEERRSKKEKKVDKAGKAKKSDKTERSDKNIESEKSIDHEEVVSNTRKDNTENKKEEADTSS